MATYTAFDPRTGEPGDATFSDATPGAIAAAVSDAERAFAHAGPPASRDTARLLRAIADELDGLGDRVIETADRETGLGRPRLTGELARTTGQWRAFASLCEEGSFVEAVIDHAVPDGRPDLRRMRFPIGPVAVFGASNFPLAFSVPGGDTASALAAGCPVVVKAHPSHPETSELTGAAIARALERAGAPAGWFSLLHGRSTAVGEALVTAPAIRAVGFTGSLRGGRALFDLAAARPEPIPVYAEMGSVNPVFVTATALEARLDAIAEGFAASMTQGTGQFCTKPGLAFVPDGPLGRRWTDQVASRLAGLSGGCLLNAGIRDALAERVGRTRGLPGVELLAGGDGAPDGPGYTYPPTVVAVAAERFLAEPALAQEHFGPFAVIVRCEGPARMVEAARALEGSLTATVHAEAADLDAVRPLVDELRRRAGRLIWNGYPTGVAVTAAMMHGGPYPATTSSLHTSVGTAAIARWLRPVAFQSYPAGLLPPALRDENPLGLVRLVDGEWTRGADS